MKNLVLNNPLNGEFKPVKDDDGTASGLSLAQGKVKIDDLEVRNLSGSINLKEDLNIFTSGGIVLASKADVVTINKISGATNTVTDVLVLKSQSTGTPAAGIGTGISFGIETAANNVEIGARIEALTTDVSSTNEDVSLVFYLMNSGDTAEEQLRIADNGNLTIGGHVLVSSLKRLYFDGGTHTSISENSDDVLSFQVGDDNMLILDEETDTITMGATNWIAGTVSGATITEFSSANSAYAGMILGYTRLEGDLTSQTTFELPNALTVNDASHQITFITPPSENVEIEASFVIDITSTDTRIAIGLSDSSSYSAKHEKFEYDQSGVTFSDDEADDGIFVVKWVLNASDLEAVGVSNTIYIAISTDGYTKTAYLRYGLRASHNAADQPMIIKATALPVTIYDGS